MRKLRQVVYLIVAFISLCVIAQYLHERQMRVPLRTALSAITPVNRNPLWHADFMKIASEGHIDLLFIGDSITAYWLDTGSERWERFRPYPAADFGVPGERTEDVIWRISNGELEGIKPTVVVLMIGTNQVGIDKAEWVAAGVKKIIETIHAKLPDSKIVLFGILPRHYHEYGVDMDPPDIFARIAAANTLLAQFDNGKDVFYQDIGAQFCDRNGKILPGVMYDDQLHLTASGYAIWYRALKPILANLMY